MKNNLLVCLILLTTLYLTGCFCFGGPGCEPTDPCNQYCPCTDGKVSALNIARWDGSQWLPLGSGVTGGGISHIVVDSSANELYVFGNFTTAGNIPVKGEAKWNEKTQTWSAISPQILWIVGGIYNSDVNASAGKLYYGILSYDKPTNSNFDRTGLYEWDGVRWRLLLNIIDGKKQIIKPVTLGIIGTTLYLASQSYKDAYNENIKIYLFDLLSNQIIDSLLELPIESFLGVTLSPEGIFIDKGDGIYHYYKGNQKKILQISTGTFSHYSKLSASSEYFTYINQQIAHDSGNIVKALIYDIKADSTFSISIQPTKSILTFSTKISGHTLFVGGAFYLKDGGADVRNIGAYDLREKKWYDLAGGVCGPVHAIAEMNGSMYVGGEFSTVGKK